MRPLVIVGILLIALGAFVLVRGGSYTSKKDVLKVGDLKVTADGKESIPPWAGGIAIIGGVVLIAAGARRPAR